MSPIPCPRPVVLGRAVARVDDTHGRAAELAVFKAQGLAVSAPKVILVAFFRGLRDPIATSVLRPAARDIEGAI
jgi:hypothetical protein